MMVVVDVGAEVGGGGGGGGGRPPCIKIRYRFPGLPCYELRLGIESTMYKDREYRW